MARKKKSSPITFPALRDRLVEVIKSVPVGEHRSGDPDSVMRLWTNEHQRAVTRSMQDTLRLLRRLAEEGTARAGTYIDEIEKIMDECLGHKRAVFDIPLPVNASGELGDIGYEDIVDSLDKFVGELRSILKVLAEEFSDAVFNKPKQGTPEAEKQHIADRLGRGRRGLDDFVSKWRQRFRKDLPWVIRKPGLPWLPDLDAFEEWRKTTEGEKAVVKRKRGRPPRS